MAKESEEPISFSPREMEVLAIAWQCFETEPKIDMKKLARLTGYTPGSASVTLGKIKRKLKIHASSLDSDDATPTATPKKPAAGATRTPRSAGKRSADPNSDMPTPSKKKKSPYKKKIHDSDDDEEFANVRVKSEEAAALMEGANQFWEQQPGMAFGASSYNDMFGYPDPLAGENA